jgi:TrmH family RNA methyltransferase
LSVLVAKAGVDGGRALARVRVVMVRTRNPMNLGAAARALRNAGLSRWTLVAPITDPGHPEVGRVAVKAEGLVQMANVVDTLEEALAGCALSVACTARQRYDRNQLHPRTAAERLVSGAAALLKQGPVEAGGATGDVVLVFGDEMNGLHTEETDLCDLLSTIPSAPEQPSWNLAQAVAIYVHELRTAALSAELGLDTGQDRKDLADGAGLAALDRTLAAMLDQFGRLRTRRRLFRTLERAQPSRREAALWTGVLENLRRALAGEPLTGGSGGPDRK